MARKSTGKKLRFEIFKRDGFKCVYCGVTPVQSVLRVDHVVPVAEGGTNAHENLVTACQDCNAGKGATPLEKKRLTKPMLTESHREHAEQIKEYLKVQKEIADARRDAAEAFAAQWEEILGPMTQGMFDRLDGLMREWPIEKLLEAVHIAARKFSKPAPGNWYSYHATKQAKYFHGVLRRWREQKEQTENGEVT